MPPTISTIVIMSASWPLVVTWPILADPTRPPPTSTFPISPTFIMRWSQPTPIQRSLKRPRPVSNNHHNTNNMWCSYGVRSHHPRRLEHDRVSHHRVTLGNISDYSLHAIWNC